MNKIIFFDQNQHVQYTTFRFRSDLFILNEFFNIIHSSLKHTVAIIQLEVLRESMYSQLRSSLFNYVDKPVYSGHSFSLPWERIWVVVPV